MEYFSGTNTMQYCNGTNWISMGSSGSSTGLVGAFSTVACPSGWIVADGSAISRTTYTSLFSSIGTTYGVGDGSTTFNLPDYRGEFLRGTDNGKGSDPDAASRTDRGDGTTGDVVGTKQSGEIQSHTHTNNNGLGGSNVSGQPYAGNIGGATGATGGSETRPRNVNVTFCVNYAASVNVGYEFSVDGSTPLTGNLKLNNNYLSNDGGNEGIRIDNTGNVGIGSSTPTAKLDVNGDIQLGNSSATCSATTEGSLRYNSTLKRMEFCNATSWSDMTVPILPTGAVMSFDLTACPTGWSEYTQAYGRVIRGIDKSGSSIDPSGQRAAGNTQEDALQQHDHYMKSQAAGVDNVVAFADPNVDATYAAGGNTGSRGDVYIYVGNVKTGRTANETRAKNVALLYCRKN